MVDEVVLNLFIAGFTIFTAVMFGYVSKSRRCLQPWVFSLIFLALGSVFVYLQVLDATFRFIGNMFYALGVVSFDVVIFHEYYHLQTSNQRKRTLASIVILPGVLVRFMLPFTSVLVQLQLYMWVLGVIASVLLYRIFVVQKTPRHAFMFLSSITGLFTLSATILSSVAIPIFWELGYVGNILFVTFILATTFVVPLEERLVNSENERNRTFEALMKRTKELQESEKRFKALYQNTRAGLVTFLPDGTIISANPAAARILGYNHLGELRTKNALDFCFSIGKQGINLLDTIKKEDYIDNLEMELKGEDGAQIYVLASVSFQKNGDDLPSRFELVFRDISARKQAELIRKDLEQKREDFVAMASHEIRTPLTVCQGYVDILLSPKGEYSRDLIREMVQKIKKNLERLERLSIDVRTAVMMEREQIHTEMTEIDFYEFILRVIEPYQQLLGNSFDYQEHCDEKSICIRGDEDLLQHAIEKVLENAIDQTPNNNRRILVKIEALKNQIMLTISDNGVGIDPEHFGVIFDKFVSIKTDQSVNGTGIGLYTAREILKAHKGTITAESKGKGFGATFIFKIPRFNLSNVLHSGL